MKNPTLQQAFDHMDQKVWPVTITPKTHRDYRYWFLRNLSHLAGKKLTAIKRADLVEIETHLCAEGKKVTFNRVKAVLSFIYGHMEKMEAIPQGVNPCRLVDYRKEEKRERYASEEELKNLYNLTDRVMEKNPTLAVFIRAMILTGARPTALQRLKWSDVKIQDNGTGFCLFDGKSGRETIILPEALMRDLANMDPREDGFVFGEYNYTRHWDKVREEINAPDLWLRDLRRTFATVGFSSGLDIGMVGELLNHTSLASTKVYAKLMPVKRIEAAEQVANTILATVKKA